MISIARIFKRQISLSSILAARVTRVPLPALSPTMESGSIVSWDKQEGDRLNEGDLLAEIETDKATMSFETPEEGFLAKILVPAGTKGVKLGQPLCIIVEEEGEIEKFKGFSVEEAIAAVGAPSEASSESSIPPTQPTAPQQPTPLAPIQQPPQTTFTQPIQSPPTQPKQFSPPTFRTFASPLARRLAKESGLELPTQGSGPNGRVVASDLEGLTSSGSGQSFGQGPPSTAEFTDIPLTNMRLTIAKRLTQSKQSVPHYYLTVNLNVDDLLDLRLRANDMLSKENVKLSVNDFIVKAAALACKRVPQVNSSWQETFVRQYNRVDVSVAVSTDNGLITPIIFGAENKGVQDIGMEMRYLAEKARAGKLQPNEFQGGTFTISNLGMFDITHFTAVINPPQSAILAVGTTQKTIVPSNDDDEKVKIVNTLNVTLSCDHRVVDGAVGAQWLRWFRKYMEKPYTMLL